MWLGAQDASTPHRLAAQGVPLRYDLTRGAATILLHESETRLDRHRARELRDALRRRGRVIVVCAAERLIDTWLTLRHAGLEPKRTALIGESTGQIREAVVLAQVAKPGGLSVHYVPSE